MKNICILLKYQFLQMFNLFYKKDKRKSSIFIKSILYIALYSMMFYYFYTMFNQVITTSLQMNMQPNSVFGTAFLSYISLCMIQIIYSTNNTKEKDSAFLLSLPLKKYQIIISKAMSLFMVYFGIGLLLILPACVCYVSAIKSATFLIFVNSFVLVMFICLICIAVHYILNGLINIVIIKSKYFNILKNIISTITYIGCFILYMNFIFSINFGSSLAFISNCITNNNYLTMLYIALFSISIFALGIYICSLTYGKSALSIKKEYKAKDFTNQSVFKTLFKKELKFYFSNPMYALNTGITYLLIIIASCVPLFLVFDKSNALIQDMFQGITYSILPYFYALSCTTNVSISLESNKFWILKTCPISPKQIITPKIAMNLMFATITNLISISLLALSGYYSWTFILLITALSIVCSIFVSVGGMLINLLCPKMDSTNPTKIIKQSLSVFVSLISFMIVFSILPILTQFQIITLQLNYIILINIGMILVLDIVIIILTNFLANKKLMYL